MAGVTNFILIVFTVGLGMALAAQAAQTSDGAQTHRLVFQVTQDGQDHWESVLNNIEQAKAALEPDPIEIEVVIHGSALGMLMADNEKQKQRIEKISKTGVVFAACENTMKRKSVTKEQLLPFVITVPSGVAEVVRKQEQGWSYLRS